MRTVRHLDKLVDELAKGKKVGKGSARNLRKSRALYLSSIAANFLP